MDNLGLNNDVLVGGRRFHVQTSYSDSQGGVVSKVFHEGQVIESKEVAAKNGATQEDLQRQVTELHQELITGMEVLYYIYEKVKSVRHANSSNKLGLLFMDKNLLDEAVEQFHLALEIDPNFYEVYSNLGRALMMSESFTKAIDILKKGVEKAPNFADIQNYLGLAYLYDRNYDDSIRHLQIAIDLNESYIGAHFHLGISYLARSLNLNGQTGMRSEEAQGKALHHLSIASDRMVDRQMPGFEQIMNLISQHSYKEAVDKFMGNKPGETLSKFISIENEFYLKFMYGGKGKDDTFIAAYVEKLRDIIEDHPNYADVRNSLGIANLIQCRNLFLKALDEFRAALKINPNFKRAEKNLKLAENDGKGFLILLRAILK